MKTPVLILHAPGTNRDHEAAEACQMAGASTEILPVGVLTSGQRRLDEFEMLVLPGGFSFGDDLGAGRIWALALRHQLREQVTDFVSAGKPVLGICNGFQALIKAGLLPTSGIWAEHRSATLTHNESGRFECRWVTLTPNPKSHCVFTRAITDPIFCPVAHGEGRVVPRDHEALAAYESGGQVTLRYSGSDGDPTAYPCNPNGSVNHIAALCNPAGNVMGMMPHPEDHIMEQQRPPGRSDALGGLGLVLFEQGVRYAEQL